MWRDRNDRPMKSTRHRLFRVTAVLVGLAILMVAEGMLRLTGFGKVDQRANPLVGFSEIRPLFVKNALGNRFEIPDSRRAFFQRDSFAATKSPTEYRIFCLGGSTVQGRPYSIETSFTTWLELSLRAADPSRTWEVVNCGGVSYASYRLTPILSEIIRHEPDLVIVYTGHNEFLEQRSYSSIKRQPVWMRNTHDLVSHLRLYGLAHSLVYDETPPEKVDLPAEVEALLDYQGGLQQYHRDDAWRDGVINEYEQNLLRLIEIAKANRVPIMLLNPVSNLRDTPPFKVESPNGFSPTQKSELQRVWNQAKEISWKDAEKKLAAVKKVIQLDDGHAEAHYLLAKVYEEMQDYEKAKQAYLRAKDRDVCPLRMLESMHDVLRSVASRHEVELIDVRALFEAQAEHGIPGKEQLIDHVHPRIEWHQKIADEIFDSMVRRKILLPRANWSESKKALYAANYQSLPENYFPESVERLRGLELWTQGRVMRLKPPDAEP